MNTGMQDTSASRRRVLIAGSASALGVAGLAACGGDDEAAGGAPSASTGGTTAAPAPSAGAATTGGLATPESANIKVVALDQVPEGGAVAAATNGLKLLVTRPAGGGDPKVFSSVCPHMGCGVAPNGTDNLKCPCHQSTFDIATGAHLNGPSPSGLPSYQAAVVDGQVVITSTTEIPGA